MLKTIKTEPTINHPTEEGVSLSYNEVKNEWATHKYNIHDGVEAGKYWGHYFQNEKDALIDFYKRVLGNNI